ncbi:hypothetical protein BDN67DRAFT_985113 [Paxillus ammoniavirescens]|nr:hypothetical protein BDN67DRAFT_985113 [Paxillus ammoniavirescens]
MSSTANTNKNHNSEAQDTPQLTITQQQLSTDPLTLMPHNHKYTPTLLAGFPTTHLSHASQLLDHIDKDTGERWNAIAQPKLLLRVFGFNGNPTTNRLPILKILLSLTVMDICNDLQPHPETANIELPQAPPPHHSTTNFPKTFLLHGITQKAAAHLVKGCVWSSKDVTFEKTPRISSASSCPKPLPNEVLSTIRSTWLNPEVLSHIRLTLEKSDTDLTENEQTLLAFSKSIVIEYFVYNPTGLNPRTLYNILATIKPATARIWGMIKLHLQSLKFPITKNGEPLKTITALTCSICHAVTHTAPICPFLAIPGWNGPLHRTQIRPPTTHSLTELEYEEYLQQKEEEELQTLSRNESIYG